jgi:hypothetical protein
MSAGGNIEAHEAACRNASGQLGQDSCIGAAATSEAALAKSLHQHGRALSPKAPPEHGEGRALQELQVSAGKGRQSVLLRLTLTAGGIAAQLFGGELFHVGGVVLAVPRPSLTGQGASCDVWSIPAPGHLDHEAAAPLAKRLCEYTGMNVSLTAGIHLDGASSEDIKALTANCHAALEQLLLKLPASS